jgi:ATP-grasp domain
VRAAVVASLAEGMPESLSEELVDLGIAPLQGIGDALRAVSAAAQVGAAQAGAADWLVPDPPGPAVGPDELSLVDEPDAKLTLRVAGVPVPAGVVVTAEHAGAAADTLGYPVVVKVVSPALPHKSDVGGVAVGLEDADQVAAAVGRMAGLGDRFLVEQMVTDAVVELVVGVRRDPETGLVLTVGAGGVLVEVLRDSASLLLPTSRAEVLAALEGLRVWPLLHGFRGRSASPEAAVTAILRIAECARGVGDRLVELEVNPLLACPGRAVAVDALLTVAAHHPVDGADVVVEEALR